MSTKYSLHNIYSSEKLRTIQENVSVFIVEASCCRELCRWCCQLRYIQISEHHLWPGPCCNACIISFWPGVFYADFIALLKPPSFPPKENRSTCSVLHKNLSDKKHVSRTVLTDLLSINKKAHLHENC